MSILGILWNLPAIVRAWWMESDLLKAEITQKAQRIHELSDQVRMLNDRKVECWKRISELENVNLNQSVSIKELLASNREQRAKLDNVAALVRAVPVGDRGSIANG